MDHKSMLYSILENSGETLLDNDGAIDIVQLQNLLMQKCPGKYHLDWYLMILN